MSYKRWWLYALVFCLLLATISPIASASPDGLEKVAQDQDFIEAAQDSPFTVIADYVFPGVENEVFATMLAGWLGTLLLFSITYGIAWLIRSKKTAAIRSG
jgi:hypothetical protein